MTKGLFSFRFRIAALALTAMVIWTFSSASAHAAVIFTTAPDHASLAATFSPSGGLALHRLALDVPSAAHARH